MIIKDPISFQTRRSSLLPCEIYRSSQH